MEHNLSYVFAFFYTGNIKLIRKTKLSFSLIKSVEFVLSLNFCTGNIET